MKKSVLKHELAYAQSIAKFYKDLLDRTTKSRDEERSAKDAAQSNAKMWMDKWAGEHNKLHADFDREIASNEKAAKHQAMIGDYVGARTHQVRVDAFKAARKMLG